MKELTSKDKEVTVSDLAPELTVGEQIVDKFQDTGRFFTSGPGPSALMWDSTAIEFDTLAQDIDQAIQKAIDSHTGKLVEENALWCELLTQVVEAYDDEKIVAHGELSEAFDIDALMTLIIQARNSSTSADYSLKCRKCGHEGFGCYSDLAQMLRDAISQNWVCGDFGEFTCPNCFCEEVEHSKLSDLQVEVEVERKQKNRLACFILQHTTCDCRAVDYKPNCPRHNALYPTTQALEKGNK
jgi:hypothetical protein